jgi:diaminopropionate ammonia-lyase
VVGGLRAAADVKIRNSVTLENTSTVFVINHEGATDPARYRELVGGGPTLS